MADAADRAEDLAAFASRIDARLAEARAADEQVRRQAVYDAAQAKADAAASMLRKTYPKLTEQIVAMVQTLAEAQADVQAANAELPHGASPLSDPEHVVRMIPGAPRQVVDEREVERAGAVGERAEMIAAR